VRTRSSETGTSADVTYAIAIHRRSDSEIGPLLLQLNAAMSAEVDALAELLPLHRVGSA
jgi:hypothetical protein